MKIKVVLPIFLIVLMSSFFCGGDDLYNAKKGVILDGTDVVSILDNSPCEGKSEFSSEFNGLKYYFCNATNKKKFDENPSKYEPAFGGWCAYALVDKPQKVEINPKNYKIVNGKVLLFYNAWGINTQEKWDEWGDDQKYFKKAQENWEKLKAKK